MEDKREMEDIFSKKIRAGRRTYFFDVRSTKAGDYYMTLTESVRTLIKMVFHLTGNINFIYTKRILRTLKKHLKK